MRSLLAAIGFLTRIPVPARVFDSSVGPTSPLPWYPLVGLLLGGLLYGLEWLIAPLPPLLAAALVLVAWVLLTGGLHLDGLADSADAWVGGLGDRERTLSIMKDPRSGPAGVAAVVLLLLLKFAALASLAPPTPALWLAPLLGRSALTAAFMVTPYVRPGGIGSALAGTSRWACGASLLLVGALAAWMGAWGLRAGLASLVVFLLWRAACMHRLGGMTGDTCGALAELVEAAVLVVLAAHA